MQVSRHRTRQRMTLLLLVGAGCINYIDRATLSIGNTAIMADLHLSYETMGWLLSALAWTYMISQIPIGLLADRLGGRVFLGASLVLCSFSEILFGLVDSSTNIFWTRALLGVGEAPLFLAGTRVLVHWFAAEERGSAIGLFNGSASLGPALAPPFLLAIMAWWGWRDMSVLVGVINLLLAVIWIVYYRDPASGEVSAPTPAHSARASLRSALRDDLGYLLRQRNTWAATAGYTGVVYLSSLYVTWLPAWLEKTENLSVIQAGLLSAFPQIFSFLGCFMGGRLMDMISQRGVAPLVACRRTVVLSMLACAILTGTLALQPGSIPAIVLLTFTLFASGVAVSCGWTLGTLIVTENRVATLEAIQNTGASLGGVLAPLLTGILATRYGSFGPAFVLACGIGLVSVVMYHKGFSGRTLKS
jgi:MFS family permease